MKNIFFLLLALLPGCTTHSQTLPLANTYAMPAGKKAVLKLPYARNIAIKAWDKPELEFNPVIRTTKEAFKKVHTVEVQDEKETLHITTDFQKDTEWNKFTSCCWCDQCDSLLQSNNPAIHFTGDSSCICFRVDYEIFLPAGAALSIETISGDIEIRGHMGELNAKTISGFVDIDRQPSTTAELRLHSVTGEIYTNFDIALDTKSSAYDKKVRTRLNGGGGLVQAETVSGDIFFRKR